MTKAISVALFGDKYSHYLPAFVRGHLNIFPRREGWRLVVHTDEVVNNNQYGKFLDCLDARDLVDVRCMGPAEYTRSMLWRLAPVFESGVDYVFCRDIDAPLMPRDRQCMEEFMKSGATTHTIHDHRAHLGIMGGLCGFDAKKFRESTKIDSLYLFYLIADQQRDAWTKHGTDQDVLNRLLLAADGPELFEHRYAGWYDGPDKFEARPIGSFPHECKYTSMLTPDFGLSPFDWHVSLGAQAEMADLLGPHLGCSGYDHEAASKFWDEEGDPRIAAAIKECERAAGL